MNIEPVQRKLGIVADGIAGPQTFNAIASYAVGRPLNFHFWDKNLNTPERLADFIAQTAHETGLYKTFEENLNYSAANALKVWPRHFNDALAKWANRNPQRIAEVAYGVKSRTGKGRMGNTLEGDGWKYRGRGALQLTGKDNYREFGKLLGLDLVNNPDLASDPDISLKIAIQFYLRTGVFKAIDEGDFLGARKIVNMGSRTAKGSPLGYPHTTDIRNKVLSLFRTP